MERSIGFSTGALALADFRRALEMMRPRHLQAVELSALRDGELIPLIDALDSLDLSGYNHISVHAPSAFGKLSESEGARQLRGLLGRGWPIVVHPDALLDRSAWDGFGPWLCIENMDKRKPIGRTVGELERVFASFPEASFCFDIGHARQVDPTMSEAALILRRFGGRLRVVHMSEVNARSGHEAISFTALNGFRKVAPLIPPGVPIILETVIPEDRMDSQLALAKAALVPSAERIHPAMPAGDRSRQVTSR
jgi:hypothetical protein